MISYKTLHRGELVIMIKKIIAVTMLAISFNASALTCTGVINEVKVRDDGFVEVYSEDFVSGRRSVFICGTESEQNLGNDYSKFNEGSANVCKARLTIAEISVATGLPVKIEIHSSASASDCSSFDPYFPYSVRSLSLIRGDSSDGE